MPHGGSMMKAVAGLGHEPCADATLRATRMLQKWRLKRVLSYIDARIDERLTLADLAAVAGMSRMHFARLFRAATGIRPKSYVYRRRIEYAQHLLLSSHQSLRAIAFNVGFQNQAHFSTTFKRYVGVTPSEWRRREGA